MRLDVPIRRVDGLPDAIQVRTFISSPWCLIVSNLRSSARHAEQHTDRDDGRLGGPSSKSVSHQGNLLGNLMQYLPRIIPAIMGAVNAAGACVLEGRQEKGDSNIALFIFSEETKSLIFLINCAVLNHSQVLFRITIIQIKNALLKQQHLPLEFMNQISLVNFHNLSLAFSD
ncbi:MAG: hypothetical protein MK299_08040 [Pseudomonadales bacterium]|nr:hypothetical protein [Pseudomonadales bacterium]